MKVSPVKQPRAKKRRTTSSSDFSTRRKLLDRTGLVKWLLLERFQVYTYEGLVNYYAGFTWLRHSKQFERERPTEGKAEREREKEREERDRSTEQREHLPGMHSALIALSASRSYTLVRAEPLKRPPLRPLPSSPALPHASQSSIVCMWLSGIRISSYKYTGCR